MKCKNNECEYQPTLKQQLIQRRSKDEIDYGKLWAKLELPKLSKDPEVKTQWQKKPKEN